MQQLHGPAPRVDREALQGERRQGEPIPEKEADGTSLGQ